MRTFVNNYINVAYSQEMGFTNNPPGDYNVHLKRGDAVSAGWEILDSTCVPGKGFRAVHRNYRNPFNNQVEQFPFEVRYDAAGNLLAVRILHQTPNVWPFLPTCPSMNPPVQDYLNGMLPGTETMYCGYYPGRPDPWFGEYYGVETQPHFVAEVWLRPAADACTTAAAPGYPRDSVTNLAYGDMGTYPLPMSRDEAMAAGYLDTTFCIPLMGIHVVWTPKSGDLQSTGPSPTAGPSSMVLLYDIAGDMIGFEFINPLPESIPIVSAPFVEALLVGAPDLVDPYGFRRGQPAWEVDRTRVDKPFDSFSWHMWWIPHNPSVGGFVMGNYRVPNTPQTLVTVCTCGGTMGQGITCNENDPTIRSYDGFYNNAQNPDWGGASSRHLRYARPDGSDQAPYFPAGDNGDQLGSVEANLAARGWPLPRVISNELYGSNLYRRGDRKLNDMHTYWGMIMTMDMCNTGRSAFEALSVVYPQCDPTFDVYCQGSQTLLEPAQTRSAAKRPVVRPPPYAFQSMTGPREVVNLDSTSYLDANWLYGITESQNTYLRTFENGRLKEIDELWYPQNMRIVPKQPNDFVFGGDIRVNKVPTLAAFHRIFIAEHNRYAAQVLLDHPEWNDEQVFQETRKWIIAISQAITTREYLAALLGEPLPPYLSPSISAPGLEVCPNNRCNNTEFPYDPQLDASVHTEFCHAALKYGHVEASTVMPRLNSLFEVSEEGPLLMRDSFFDHSHIENSGVEVFLRGMVAKAQSDTQLYMIDDMRNYMFGPKNGGADLASINLYREVEVGVPTYNMVRENLGLGRRERWEDLTDDVVLQEKLASVFGSNAQGGIDRIDLWTGGLCEKKWEGASVGETFWHIVRNQFLKVRHGDRFWYEHWRYWGDDSMDEQTRREYSANMTAKVYQRKLEVILSENSQLDSDELGEGIFFLKSRQLETLVALGNAGEVQVDSSCKEEGGCRFDERASRLLSPSFKVWWRFLNEGSEIEFQLQVVATGWVGIGFEPYPNTMRGADIYFCRVFDNNGTVEVRDSYAMDVGPPRLDIDACEDWNGDGRYEESECFGTDDVLHEYDYGVQNDTTGITVIRFRRRVDTGDRFDKPIPYDQEIQTIFAFNPDTDNFRYHGPTRSPKASINYYIGPFAPYEYSKVSLAVRIFIGVMGGIGVVLVLFLLLLLAVKTEHFRFMAPMFVTVLLVGAAVAYSALFTLVEQPPSDAACVAFPWLAGIGFVLLFACLFAKTFRIWRLLTQNSLKATLISNQQLFAWIAGLFLVEVIYLAVWTGVDTPEYKLERDDDDQEQYDVCDTDDGWWIGWVAMKIAYIALGSLLSIFTRKLPDEFNDASAIGISMWTLFLIGIMAVGVGFGLQDTPTAIALVQAMAIFVGITATLVLLFGPVLYRMLVQGKDPRTFKSTVGMGSSGGSSFRTTDSLED